MSHDSQNSDAQLPEAAQTRRHLARVVERLDDAHERLGRLVELATDGAAQLDALARHLTSPGAARPSDERLAELASGLESLGAQVAELGAALTRLNRAQFKASALAEAQEQRAGQAIALLQDLLARREAAGEVSELDRHEQLESLRAGARAELAADLLPSVDGLDQAIESGRKLIARRSAEAANAAERSTHGLLWRLTHPGAGASAAALDATALEGWLGGLELVRERFLALLAAEGIRPIAALGEPFDPRLHVAVGAREGATPGMVVEVVRAGYRRAGSVLRYAEVIVARAPEALGPAPFAFEDAEVENER